MQRTGLLDSCISKHCSGNCWNSVWGRFTSVGSWKLCSWGLLSHINNNVFWTLCRRQNEIDLPVLPLLLSAGNSSTLWGIWCEAAAEKKVSRSHFKKATNDSRCNSVTRPWQSWLVSTIGSVLMTFLLLSRPSIWLRNRLRRDLDRVSVGKTEKLQNFVSPDDLRVALLPHSRWDHRFLEICESLSFWLVKKKNNNQEILRSDASEVKSSLMVSVFPPARTSVSETRGLKPQAEDKVVRWAPA